MKTSTSLLALFSGILATLLFTVGFHATAQKLDPVGAKSSKVSSIESLDPATTPCMSCATPPESVA